MLYFVYRMFFSGLGGMRHAFCFPARNVTKESGKCEQTPDYVTLSYLDYCSAQPSRMSGTASCKILSFHKVNSGAAIQSSPHLSLTKGGKRNRKPVKAIGKTMELKACIGTVMKWVVNESWQSARRFRETK